MLFHAEVHQFIIFDDSIIVVVIPKNILYEVMYLILILLKHTYQKISDLVLVEAKIKIYIELDYALINYISHCEG